MRQRFLAAGVVVLVAALGLVGWQVWQRRQAASVEAPMSTVLYSWQDAAGVMHYSQEPPIKRPPAGKAHKVVVDTARITPLLPPPSQPLLRPTLAADPRQPTSGLPKTGVLAGSGPTIRERINAAAIDEATQ
jgi:hypothetical protein